MDDAEDWTVMKDGQTLSRSRFPSQACRCRMPSMSAIRRGRASHSLPLRAYQHFCRDPRNWEQGTARSRGWPGFCCDARPQCEDRRENPEHDEGANPRPFLLASSSAHLDGSEGYSRNDPNRLAGCSLRRICSSSSRQGIKMRIRASSCQGDPSWSADRLRDMAN